MINIGGRQIGDGAPCFVTFEAGPTHSGLESAMRLVSFAAEAGADAVKFQIIDPDRLISDHEVEFSYEVLVDRETGRSETVTEPLYDILKRRTMPWDDWRELKRHSDGLNISFFATVGFEDEIGLLEDMGCHSIKIASGDVNHLPLIRSAARTGLCVQLDTGHSDLGEIKAAVDAIRGEGNENIIIHHCPGGYPACEDSINLNVIGTLKRMFPYPIAFSDHTTGWDMDIAAVALGANLVEKTITSDRTTRGIEHIMSLEPWEMKTFVRAVRLLEAALGEHNRVLSPEERRNRVTVRRSANLVTGGRAGQQLRDLEVEFRRPGIGLPPDVFEESLDRRLKTDLPADHVLTLTDVE